jgi:hypothetical protein
MRRVILAVVTIATIASPMIGLAPAHAAKPAMQRSGETVVDLHFPAHTLCSFPLDVHQVSRTKLITFVDANGHPTRAISTGPIHDWETDVATGQTQFHSISGPSFFDATGALVRGTGSWSGVQLEDGTWVRTHGLITFDMALLVTAVRGRVEDLCGSFA